MKRHIKERAFKKGNFTLSSGKKSRFYIDIKKVYTSPQILRKIAKNMAEELSHLHYDLLAGVAVGAVPIVAATALEVGRDYLVVRKERKGHGTGMGIEGRFSPGQKVVMLEDVTTTGGSLIRAVRELRAKGLGCEFAITVVDREEGAKENLKKEKVELIPLVKMSEIKVS